MDKRDVLVMTVIIAGVGVSVVLISLLANETQIYSKSISLLKRKCYRFSKGN
jgi:hypothetical protein